MTLFSWIIFGLIIGVLASIFEKQQTFSGTIRLTTLSIFGAIIGGLGAFFLFETLLTRIDPFAFSLALIFPVTMYALVRGKRLI